jgi:hypothetical protein
MCLLRRNKTRRIMFDRIDIGREQDGRERQVGGWRVVASAWVLVLVFLLLLGGVSAVAGQHRGAAPLRPPIGAFIPQHDPCSGPGVPSAPGRDGCKSIQLTPDRSHWSDYW